MATTNLFEYSVRNKLRFPSSKGELTVEQLLDVPLRSRDGFDLNAIARTVNKSVTAETEENFVETTKTAKATRAERTLEVVKLVIETKLADEAAAETRAAKKQEKEELLQILAEKQKGALSDLTEKELKRRIAALGE